MRTWILFLIPLLLPAQGEPFGRRMAPRGPEGPILAHLQKVRQERIQAALGVSEDKARAISEAWERRDRALMERGRDLAEVRRRCQDILQGPGTDAEKDGRVRPLLERLHTLRQHQHETRQRFEDEVRTSLSPTQQVRFMLLVEDLDRHVREGMRALKGGRRE